MINILNWNNGIFAELNEIINNSIQAIDHELEQRCTGYPNSKHQLFATDSGWAARVDLPGYAKEEISLNFENHKLILKASNEQRGDTHLSLALGEEVEISNISAKLNNGILEITLPKIEDKIEEAKIIEIQ